MKFTHKDIWRSDATDKANQWVLFEEYQGGGCYTMLFESKEEAEAARAEFVRETEEEDRYVVRSMPEAVACLFDDDEESDDEN